MGNRPEKLGLAMGAALKGLNLDLRMREGKAMALWPDIVGEVTANRTRPLYVNRGTLVVLVASSAWANQLNLLKPKLLEAFSQRCGPGVIKDIRWKNGEQEADNAKGELGPVLRPRRPQAPDDTPIAPEERATIDSMLRAITDPQLAKTVERTLVAQAPARAAQAHRLGHVQALRRAARPGRSPLLAGASPGGARCARSAPAARRSPRRPPALPGVPHGA